MRIFTISKWVFMCISLALVGLNVYYYRREDADSARKSIVIACILAGLMFISSVIEALQQLE